jgi:Ni,Fe-hydrogenase maturation factor
VEITREGVPPMIILDCVEFQEKGGIVCLKGECDRYKKEESVH